MTSWSLTQRPCWDYHRIAVPYDPKYPIYYYEMYRVLTGAAGSRPEEGAREREWATLPSLSDGIERLRDLLRQHGIDPRDRAA